MFPARSPSPFFIFFISSSVISSKFSLDIGSASEAPYNALISAFINIFLIFSISLGKTGAPPVYTV